MSVLAPIPAKAELRRRFLDVARQLSAPERLQLSAQVQQHLLDLPQWKDARGIALYRAISGEVSLQPLFERLEAEGRRAYLPRVDGPDAMSLRLWRSTDPLETIAFGVRQPCADAPVAEPTDVQLILAPGLAFDDQGTRLGRGAGYYDRMLPRFRAMAYVAGVCFAVQRIDRMPRDPWDIPVDGIVTERGLFIPHPPGDAESP